MVFFTCNKCGESLKKKDVEKHCNTRCRGPPYLTCVDCLKDFCEEYVKHTTCVTEDDRYSAMGLKGLQTKQKSKQQQWVETVQDCLSRAIDDGVPGMTPSLRSLMLYLQDQAVLPDKGKAFINFIKNARRSEPLQNIEFVWNILEKARNDLQAKQKAEREAAEAERRKAKEQQKQQRKAESSESSDDDSSDSDTEKGAPQNGASKKKLQSQPETFNEVANGKGDKKKKRMVSESESIANGASELRKAKKKKRNPESECQEGQENEGTSNLNTAMDACHLNIQAPVIEDEKLTKKEKKEKKKRGKYEAELKEIEASEVSEQLNVEGEQEVAEEDTEGKKGKKKKKNRKNSEVNPVEEAEPVEGTEKKKKDKKKKKGQQQEESEDMDTGNTDQKTKKSENGKLNDTLNFDMQEKVKFSWDAAILQVLESQEEISLKRLSKKVISEYLTSLGENEHVDEAQIMTKFQKRLHKMHNVLVHKDKVRLKTSRD